MKFYSQHPYLLNGNKIQINVQYYLQEQGKKSIGQILYISSYQAQSKENEINTQFPFYIKEIGNICNKILCT